MKTENEEKKAKDQADIFKKSGRKKAVRDNTETRIVRVPVFSETKVATAEDIGESEQIDVRLPRRATVFNKQGERRQAPGKRSIRWDFNAARMKTIMRTSFTSTSCGKRNFTRLICIFLPWNSPQVSL